MAVINLIRFDRNSGALIADEEQWHQGVRRLLSFDNLQSLLDKNGADELGIDVVFGSVGTPSLGYEGVQRIKKRLKERIAAKERVKELRSVAGIVQIAVEELRKLIRERINQKLNYCFGFDGDDFNRGFFMLDQEKIEIKQEAVLKEARAIATLDSSSAIVQPIISLDCVLAGCDREKGFTWYTFTASDGQVMVGTGNFESLGKGSDVSTLSLIDFSSRKQLKERRDGTDTFESLLALIRSFNSANRFNHEIGGYPQLVLINGAGQNHEERYREILGSRPKLACEILVAMDFEFISEELAKPLIRQLLFENLEEDKAEEQLFAQAKDGYALEHFLRGYKFDSLPRRKQK